MTTTATPTNRPLGHRQYDYLNLLARKPMSIQACRRATGLDRQRCDRGYRPMHTLAARGLVQATSDLDANRGQLWIITDAGREALGR